MSIDVVNEISSNPASIDFYVINQISEEPKPMGGMKRAVRRKSGTPHKKELTNYES
jgi:hypothetical protein